MSDRSTADEHPAAPGGNTPIEKLIDFRIFQTYVVVADFYDI
jgi:hypothetical protein